MNKKCKKIISGPKTFSCGDGKKKIDKSNSICQWILEKFIKEPQVVVLEVVDPEVVDQEELPAVVHHYRLVAKIAKNSEKENVAVTAVVEEAEAAAAAAEVLKFHINIIYAILIV